MPFDQDRTHAHYDADYVKKFWSVLLRAQRVMNEFRARFIGKASPVHFFWGSFDLAVTRFSGRTAPPPTSVMPNVALGDDGSLFARSLELRLLAGQWRLRRAAFYAYAYPEPAGYSAVPLRTAGAFYDKGLGQFILPYDAVRAARDPDALLVGFFQEAYDAAADLGHWDRKALERGERSAITLR